MRFSHDRRGQSVVIGTVILFGFLILALSLYQVQVVPQENSNVEFEHSQQVEGEFLDLRNAVLSASRTGDGRSTSLKLGTRYPQRTFALNPPQAAGELSTSEPRELRIENVSVDADGNAGAYWTNRTETGDAVAFDTRSLRYASGYNEFRNGPDLVYEHSLVVAEFGGTALARSGQTAVDGDRNRIRLTALDGDVDEFGVERISLDPETLSESRRSVTLTSTGGDPIVLELPTDVSAESAGDLEQAWERRLGDDAENVTVAGGTVRIELDGSETYRLELGKVGLGTGATATDESDGYITRVSSEGGVATVEVRDEFNNPVEGASVDVSAEGTFQETLRTDENGQVSYFPDGVRPEVRMTINDGTEEWEEAVFEEGSVGVGGGDGAGGGTINPSESTDIVLTDVGVGGGGQRVVDLQFRNSGDETRTFELMEFTVYYQPNGETQESLTIQDTGQTLALRGGFGELNAPIEIPAGGTETLTVEFPGNAAGDLLGVSFITDTNRQALYLAGIEGEVDQADETGQVGDGSEVPTTQNGISYEGDLTTTETNSAIQFDIQNVDTDFARIESVAVESTIGDASHLYNGDGGRIIETAGADSDGYRATEPGGSPNSRAVDTGSSIDLTQNAVLSTNGGGQDASVFIGQFGTTSGNQFTQYNFDTLSRVSESDSWDVRIILEFQNRGDVTFYFQEQ